MTANSSTTFYNCSHLKYQHQLCAVKNSTSCQKIVCMILLNCSDACILKSLSFEMKHRFPQKPNKTTTSTVSFRTKWKQNSLLRHDVARLLWSLPSGSCHTDIKISVAFILHKSSVAYSHSEPRTVRGEFKFLSVLFLVTLPFSFLFFRSGTWNSYCGSLFITDVSSIDRLLWPGDHWFR